MLHALIVIYFVDQFRLLTSLLPLVGRLIFGGEMLGGTLFLIWLIRTKHLPSIGANTTKLFAQAVRLLVKIGLIVFPVTLMANIFGYVELTNLLAGGIIERVCRCVRVYRAARCGRSNHYIARDTSSRFNARSPAEPADASAAYLCGC